MDVLGRGWGCQQQSRTSARLLFGGGGLNESEDGLLGAACGRRDVPLRAPSGILMCAGGVRPQQGAQREAAEKQVHTTLGPAGRWREGRGAGACRLIHAVLGGPGLQGSRRVRRLLLFYARAHLRLAPITRERRGGPPERTSSASHFRV